MTPKQRMLVEKTLGLVGYLALLGAIALVLLAIGILLTPSNKWDVEDFLVFLFDVEEAGIIFYPLVSFSITSLWIRAYLRAGRESI
ncbi:hypothetical protein A3194_12270 [Candidatus Thiodiazotropha endoloripes]|nr:hypothetical protein A3194_12270 [Candidatus Thiodiazotropha endoloripes]